MGGTWLRYFEKRKEKSWERTDRAGGLQVDNANFEKRGFAATNRERSATNGCSENAPGLEEAEKKELEKEENGWQMSTSAQSLPCLPTVHSHTSYTLIHRCNTDEKEAFCSQIPRGTPQGHISKSRQLIARIYTIECDSPPAPLISQSIDFNNRLYPPEVARLSRCRKYRIRCIVGHRGSEINWIEQGGTR